MNILVVDDEQDMQTLFLQKFRREIRDNKVNFAFATSGEEALAYMKEHDHEAVLILSDINMPGMTGLELLEQIKKKFDAPSPVVMMVTAYADEENYNQAMKLGADDFLNKPINFDDLKQRLKI
jgi:two-component system, chemotaxis family, chemotaxis protein CheY